MRASHPIAMPRLAKGCFSSPSRGSTPVAITGRMLRRAGLLTVLLTVLPLIAGRAQIAVPDTITMRLGGKARINVIANDVGSLSNLVQIVSPPVFGTAVVNSDSTVLYTHTVG